MVGKIVWIFCLILYPASLHATGKEYKYKNQPNWSWQQKENRKEKKIYVTCRLKTQKTYKGRMACIYQGANKTYELEFTDTFIGCPRQFKCLHNPNSKEPSIDDVLDSLRQQMKKGK